VIPDRLFEDAAERSRESMRTRWGRVRNGWRTLVQAGIAVSVAYAVAKWAWGHKTPFFAPISAIIALGTSYFERTRRAAELVAGVTLGVAAADVLAIEIGQGVAQLALAVFIAIGLGVFFGTSQLFVNQVAVSAVLVFTVTSTSQSPFSRAVDALVGGTVALVVAAVLLPADPVRILRDAARPVLEELADTLADIAAALRTRDHEAAEDTLVRARGNDGEGFHAAARESRSAARLSPARRRARDTVEFYAQVAERVDLAVRNARVLARGTLRALSLDDNVPPDVPDAIDELAAGVRALWRALETGQPFDGVREPVLRAAASATRVLEGTANLSVSVIVGQIRSTANDLLTATGLSYEEAADAVRNADARMVRDP
jgi:uncharacterized membrane protein YgaE (UPF0421/DUF939 family)